MNKKQQNVLNLKREFGDRYKIDVDPAFHVPNQPPEDKEWLYLIPCGKGGEDAHIYTHGYRDSPHALGFFGTSSRIKKRLLDLPPVEMWVEGDSECLIVFPLASFAQVAAIVRPKKKRRMKAKQQEMFVAAGRKNQFGRVAND